MKKNDKKFYSYKVKRNCLKKGALEQFGFAFYVPEDNSDKECFWARPLELNRKGKIAGFLKYTIEKFYNNGDCSESMLKEVEESGYEFDKEGKLIENEAYLSGLKGQLCVSVLGSNSGVLFINVDGIEFYDTETINGESSIFEIVKNLLDKEIVYRKRLQYYAN